MEHVILYFSATGNTRDVVHTITRRLEASGDDVRVVEIRRPPLTESDRELISGAEHLVVGFPVYAWAPPSFVMRLLRGLPQVRRPGSARNRMISATVVAVDGGNGARAGLTAARCLERRGYTVVRVARVGYPENWSQFVPPPGPEDCRKLIESGRTAAAGVADMILRQERSFYAPHNPIAFFADGVGVLFRLAGRRILGQTFVAGSLCTSCRLCERKCPVGAITMQPRRGSRPRWNVKCELCNRCINICPERAINTSWFRLLAILCVVVGLSVGAIIATLVHAPSFPVFRIVLIAGSIVVAHAAVFPVGALISRFEHLPGFRRLTYASITSKTGRYWLAHSPPDDPPGAKVPRPDM